MNIVATSDRPAEPYTLDWWQDMHTAALNVALGAETEDEKLRYLNLASWINDRIVKWYDDEAEWANFWRSAYTDNEADFTRDKTLDIGISIALVLIAFIGFIIIRLVVK